jgi:hypothetical protein
MTTTMTIEAQSIARREELTLARARILAEATLPCHDAPEPAEPRRRRRNLVRNAVLVATEIEIRCPYCGVARPAPDGSPGHSTKEALDACERQIEPCGSCGEPIRMAWHDKIGAGW